MNGLKDFPINVMFRNLVGSPAMEEKARRHAEKLGKYFGHILSCNVIIESHHNHYRGNIYQVSVHVKVPNVELAVNRNPAEHHAHEDVYVAIRDAFSAIKRKLQTYAHKLQGEVKHHTLPLQGRVLEIAPIADFGLIETNDGHRVRFTSNSVIDFDFKKLEIGDKVRFIEVESINGPAASSVYVK
jgi:ribosomal subunit interface protein